VGRDSLTGGTGADTFIFRNGDSLVATFDTINDFVSGTDKVDLHGVGAGGLAASAYAETSVNSNNFNTVLAAATALMADGTKSAVFVAGSANGWLFWNTDSNHTTIEEGARLNGVTTLAGFQVTDLS
jgi:Ca2+-binding RTX toxin-like protein